MKILFFIVAFIAVIISLSLIVIGQRKKVPSCTNIGLWIFAISVLVIVFHFMELFVPLSIIFIILGTISILMGTATDGEQQGISQSGMFYCFMGLVFYSISYYYLYVCRFYTIIAIISFAFACVSFVNMIRCKKNPVLSCFICLIFILTTACFLKIFSLNGLVILLVGSVIGLFLQGCWILFIEQKS